MIKFIEKHIRNRVIDRHAREAESLVDSLYEGQTMLIWKSGGKTRVYTLENIDVSQCDREETLYADDAKYVNLTPCGALRIHADLSTPPWLEHLLKERPAETGGPDEI